MDARSQSSTQDAVMVFLRPLDREHPLIEFAEATLQAADADDSIRRDLAAIKEHFGSARVPAGQKAINDILAALYLRAEDKLLAANSSGLSEAVGSNVGRALTTLKALEPTFWEALLSELRQRSEKNSLLATRLDNAQRELSQLKPQLTTLATRLPNITNKDQEDREALAAIEPEPEPTRLRCYIGDQQVSCWLVFALIIIILVV